MKSFVMFLCGVSWVGFVTTAASSISWHESAVKSPVTVLLWYNLFPFFVGFFFVNKSGFFLFQFLTIFATLFFFIQVVTGLHELFTLMQSNDGNVQWECCWRKHFIVIIKVKFSYTCYQALGLELILVYRQSAHGWPFKSFPGGRLPLLSAMLAVTFPDKEHYCT